MRGGREPILSLAKHLLDAQRWPFRRSRSANSTRSHADAVLPGSCCCVGLAELTSRRSKIMQEFGTFRVGG